MARRSTQTDPTTHGPHAPSEGQATGRREKSAKTTQPGSRKSQLRGSSAAESRPHKPGVAGANPAPAPTPRPEPKARRRAAASADVAQSAGAADPGPAPATQGQPQRAAEPAIPGGDPGSSPGVGANIPSDHLPPKRRAFVVAYLRSKNATAAALEAGYSPATARQQGARLLSFADVAAEVSRLETAQLANVQAATGVTLEQTVREIARLAFHDPRRFFDEHGNLVAPPALDDDTKSALAGFEVTEIGGQGQQAIARFTSKVKIGDRTKALDMLMKHLGGYKADNDQRGAAVGEVVRDFFAGLHDAGQGRAIPVRKQRT